MKPATSAALLMLSLVTGAVIVLLLSACAPQQSREQANPAPSAFASKESAMAAAKLWAMLDIESRSVCEVLPTGSMLPVFDSRSVLLRERVAAAQLQRGDLASYVAANGQDVTHRVIEVRTAAVLFDGDNNNRSDGWIPADRVRYRVAGILFSQR